MNQLPAPLTPQRTLQDFALESGRIGRYHALHALPGLGLGDVSRLPVSLRILLESMLRQVDGERVTEEQVRALCRWKPNEPRTTELPVLVARILLQDFTGVPLLCDLAALRDTATRLGRSPGLIEPKVPVDLVIDHSVQVDHHRETDSLDLNMALELARNGERYRFLKWGMQAFERLRVVPPGVGIVHQVNLEHLAPGVHWQGDLCFPDTLVGTDSHTTMINALGVVGWGVGGIEAEAAMLGLPVTLLMPDVTGVQLLGRLRPGATATDLVLSVTERLREIGVVGQFVEYFGEGAASLSLPDRATVSNMAPEYGATVGVFPPDETAAAYLLATGRSAAQVDSFRSYFRAQHLFGMPVAGDIDYSRVVTLDLDSVVPCVAGPGRPQDRVALPALGRHFLAQLGRSTATGGFGRDGPADRRQVALPGTGRLTHGDVVLAAITSCTNTSNPQLMLAAGLLARAAAARGLRVPAHVKTSLAPGSRVVTDYLDRAGLLVSLAQLGFRVVAYGCTTCIGNSGPLPPEVEEAIDRDDLVCAAVLSGNRNFEARIHPRVQANYLMCPALVVAFALAGRVDIDLEREHLGTDALGRAVYLRDIWPTDGEVDRIQAAVCRADDYRSRYAGLANAHPTWLSMACAPGELATWVPSTYIARPPWLDDFEPDSPPWRPVRGARVLAILGDSITTDHISPAGAIDRHSPAGVYLLQSGVPVVDFNSYGSRRGHHEVMVRGTFANVRIRNLMLAPDDQGRPQAGGRTLLQPEGRPCSIYEAAMAYQRAGTPAVVVAGRDYGSGSSRDWAAKGTRLLGVRAVLAGSFERIHRSNLVGMGVMPLQFAPGDSVASLGLRGDELLDLPDLFDAPRCGQQVTVRIGRADGSGRDIEVLLRIDTPAEQAIFADGGLLPHVMRRHLRSEPAPS